MAAAERAGAGRKLGIGMTASPRGITGRFDGEAGARSLGEAPRAALGICGRERASADILSKDRAPASD
jgi:hypothetical protein